MRIKEPLGTIALLLLAVPALAQGEEVAAMLPSELSIGVAGVRDVTPGQMSWGLNVGLSRVYVRDQWIEPALEMGIGPTSDVALCQDQGSVSPPDTCPDAYVLVGPRFRPLRESDRAVRPFVHFLMGAYWRGTGLKDSEYLPGAFAFQAGGGLDLRGPSSVHGLRVEGDYRYVPAAERARRQLQFVVSYFVGWRGPNPSGP